MARTVNTPPVTMGSEAALRLVEANRAKFDCPTASPGAPERRVQALEAELSASRAEAVELRRRLRNFETSTSWRLTRPLRWTIEMLRPKAAPPVPPAPPPVTIPTPLSYEDWIRTEEPAALATLAQPGPGRQPSRTPRLGLVLLAADDAPALLDPSVVCPDGCQIVALEQGDTPPRLVARAMEALDAELVCFHDPRDRLAPGALTLASHVLAQYPVVDLVFADEDWLDAEGRRVRPFFKPGWAPELQRGRDLAGPFAFFRTELVRRATVSAGPAWRYDLANQIAAATRPERIHHIPAVLCHRTVPPRADAMREAAEAQLRRDGIAARVIPVPDAPDRQRVAYDLPQPEPMVSVIVPSRDRADLLRCCADGVLNQTAYQRLELLIVDNGTVEPDALALLDALSADARVRVLSSPGPFNWSALNNAAAAQARGEVLLLLNNDIAVLQPDWLTVLVSHAVQPGIGAVGAKLLYPDGRVQHAGLTTDQSGIPRHQFRYAPGEATGAFDLLALAREVWGVTGACMAVQRRIFFEVGGLNEALPVAYNDIDLCLRLTAHGYRIVWTPWCQLEHRELASRPPDHSAARRALVQEERDRLLRDWGSLVLHDPYFHANLSLVDGRPCFRRSV